MGDDCLSPYAGLILDGFLKREESFLSIDEILSSWHFVDSLNDCMKEHSIKLTEYADDGDGPKEQNDLPNMDNHQWYDPDPV
jgi:glucose-6-phosphate 1-dehydrogenase